MSIDNYDSMHEFFKHGSIDELVDFIKNTTTDKNTILRVVVMSDRAEILPTVLKLNGVDVNHEYAGTNMLTLAVKNWCMETMKILLRDSRVDVNKPDSDGRTPLWWMSFYGNVEMIKWMIASGREINLDKKGEWDDQNMTPIEVAKDMYKTKVVSLLERFSENQEQTRREIRKELGLGKSDAAEVFATIVFLCDDFLSLKLDAESSEGESAKQQRARKFFMMTKRVPMELQMKISNNTSFFSDDIVPTRLSEPAFKKIAKEYQTQ